VSPVAGGACEGPRVTLRSLLYPPSSRGTFRSRRSQLMQLPAQSPWGTKAPGGLARAEARPAWNKTSLSRLLNRASVSVTLRIQEARGRKYGYAYGMLRLGGGRVYQAAPIMRMRALSLAKSTERGCAVPRTRGGKSSHPGKE
jgi:hypothetical protein